MKRLLIYIMAPLLLVHTVPARLFAQTQTVFSSVIISELQTGGITEAGVEDGRLEFVELYNPTTLQIDVSGWTVEYLSGGNDGTEGPTRQLARLEGVMAPGMHMLLSRHDYIATADSYFEGDDVSSSGLLAKSGGHVRVVTSAKNTVDLVTWGSSSVVIGQWWRSPVVLAGQSIQRIMPDHSLFTTGRAFHSPSPMVTPHAAAGPISQSPNDLCQEAIITEIFPNPAGQDTSREFIELHNPLDQPISLKGCFLRLHNTREVFPLPDRVLAPGEYRAFYDSDTGLTLPNSSAQPLWLLAPDGAAIEYAYPDAMEENIAWVLIDDSWQRGVPTPDAPNQKWLPAEDPSSHDPDTNAPPAGPAPCEAGKERNPATGRCRSIDTSPAIQPCKPGTTRNPDTGRCKSVIAPSVAATPCKPGQERNPDTNRCRSILGAGTAVAPKPCPAGQERNPDTNRCRKVLVASQQIATVNDVPTKSSGSDLRWWILGIVVAGCVGYVCYEWRYDIANVLHKLKQKGLGGRK